MHSRRGGTRFTKAGSAISLNLPPMKRILPAIILGSALIWTGVARAVVATGLSSFDGMEQPSVKYYPAQHKFEPDKLIHITDEGGGVIRMYLRYSQDWWDGDRDTTNKDRQRAEVKGLGPHQFIGDTFEYSTTFRTNPEFKGTGRFCHVFQLKAINGQDGAPLVTVTLNSGSKGSIRVSSGDRKASGVAREFTWKAGVWETVRVRIKVSKDNDGEVVASVNGDPFQGKTGVAVYLPDSTEYRPKWGMYRGVNQGMDIENDYAEHKNVSAVKLPADAAADAAQAALENHARLIARQGASPQAALAWLQAQPASAARDTALTSMIALWGEKDPAAALDWAEKLPPGETRRNAELRVFIHWTDVDPAPAMQWIAARAPRADLDVTLYLLATDTTFRYVNRPIALQGAAMISARPLRLDAFEEVTGIWARRDAAAAAQFIRQTPALDSTEKEAALQKLHLKSGTEG
jgi:hypothetical protein